MFKSNVPGDPTTASLQREERKTYDRSIRGPLRESYFLLPREESTIW